MFYQQASTTTTELILSKSFFILRQKLLNWGHRPFNTTNYAYIIYWRTLYYFTALIILQFLKHLLLVPGNHIVVLDDMAELLSPHVILYIKSRF